MTCEKGRHTFDNARSVNPVQRIVSLTEAWPSCGDLRLRLEVLHYIQEPVVDIRVINEADLHLI